MKRPLIWIAFIVSITLILAQSVNQKGYSDLSGAPIARTGSPFDNGGTACNANGCHTGSTPINETGWITSTIPGTGYVPGNTYTITGTAASGSLVRFGFEISPQTTTGALAGTNIITNTTQTKLASNNPKYVTHTQTGTSASSTPGTKSWSFNWTAPSGIDTVIFYGAFNCTNNNGNTSGDVVHKSQLMVLRDLTTGWSNLGDKSFSIYAYPNPAYGKINITLTAKRTINCSASLVDMTGKSVKEYPIEEATSGSPKNSELNLSGVVPGIYFLRLSSGDKVAMKKIIVM